MTQGFNDEFETIEILINSKTKTGRTDAFIIAFTKLEKQARRIFTYTVYQFPAFGLSQYKEILAVIASKRFLYFDNFIKGFDDLYPQNFESIVGSDVYKPFLSTDFPRIQKLRNKILHGQPTGKNLSANDLKKEIGAIQKWCQSVAESMMTEIGFDGLEWNSFRKNCNKNLAATYKVNISDLNMLNVFIETNMR
ncbi:MAG: hypothetical protein AB1453_04395 [Chloroflexota bacterium]